MSDFTLPDRDRANYPVHVFPYRVLYRRCDIVGGGVHSLLFAETLDDAEFWARELEKVEASSHGWIDSVRIEDRRTRHTGHPGDADPERSI